MPPGRESCAHPPWPSARGTRGTRRFLSGRQGRKDFALYLQSQSSRVFAVDIHPAARIGNGIMLDHATGIVIGETAVVGDNCSILQGVTLGGTGKERDDRHPKIGCGVLLGVGAKVLGNIKVGDCSVVGAGSVVVKEVPPRATVAGVPARRYRSRRLRRARRHHGSAASRPTLRLAA